VGGGTADLPLAVLANGTAVRLRAGSTRASEVVQPHGHPDAPLGRPSNEVGYHGLQGRRMRSRMASYDSPASSASRIAGAKTSR
jgi:hypothetical protein